MTCVTLLWYDMRHTVTIWHDMTCVTHDIRKYDMTWYDMIWHGIRMIWYEMVGGVCACVCVLVCVHSVGSSVSRGSLNNDHSRAVLQSTQAYPYPCDHGSCALSFECTWRWEPWCVEQWGRGGSGRSEVVDEADAAEWLLRVQHQHLQWHMGGLSRRYARALTSCLQLVSCNWRRSHRSLLVWCKWQAWKAHRILRGLPDVETDKQWHWARTPH